MDKIDVVDAIPILKEMNINLDKLSPERLEALMKITDSIKDPSELTPEIIRKMVSIANCSSIFKK